MFKVLLKNIVGSIFKVHPKNRVPRFAKNLVHRVGVGSKTAVGSSEKSCRGAVVISHIPVVASRVGMNCLLDPGYVPMPTFLVEPRHPGLKHSLTNQFIEKGGW